MELDKKTLQKLADLSKLAFSEQELEAIGRDLTQMVGFVEKLNEIDTTGIEPLTHMGTSGNRLREDEVSGSVEMQTALKNAPVQEGNFFTVPKVIKK